MQSKLRKQDGFFLNENESEAIYLDDIIFQDLSPILQEELNHQQYYGYVHLHISTFSPQPQVYL